MKITTCPFCKQEILIVSLDEAINSSDIAEKIKSKLDEYQEEARKDNTSMYNTLGED